MEGENVLLIAPTASGKTEAALLPVFSALMEEPHPPGGIEVVYITPLRALNRDIHKRMMYWADRLGVTVQVRHGDTSQRDRRRQSVKPPRFLITTPETLQAILPTKAMRDHLKTVRWVIVDEIHDLAASKRGVQLTIGLERLEKVAEGPVQRIGLSATVGNPDEVAGFLGGIHPVNVIEVEVDKVYSYDVEFPEAGDDDFDLASDLSTSPEAAARLRRILALIEGKKSTLVFVQGRGQAESLGHKLGRMEPLIEVHHGSLSREQRHAIEDRFKAGELKGIICTSTLQLGIDIGNVDLTIQYLSARAPRLLWPRPHPCRDDILRIIGRSALSDIFGNAFLNQAIGPGIIWVLMLEFFILLILSVWQKGLLSGLSSSRATEPEEEERATMNEDIIPQHPEQMVFIEIEVEAGE